MSCDPELEVTSKYEVSAEIMRYVITGDDIYIVNQLGQFPQWYIDLINNSVDFDDVNSTTDELEDRIDLLDTGYTNLVAVTDDTVTTLEALKVTDDTLTAAILRVDQVKITDTDARAISSEVIGSYFNDGTAGAWFNQQVSTIASTAYAAAQSASNLTAYVNGVQDNLTIAFGEIDDLKNQVDGTIETLFFENTAGNLGPNIDGTDNIDLTKEPYVSWLAADLLSQKTGDTYVLYELDGSGNKLVLNSWQFGKLAVADEPISDANGYFWRRNTDPSINDIYEQIGNAQTTADGKIASYITYDGLPPSLNSDGLPFSAVNKGDLWFNAFFDYTLDPQHFINGYLGGNTLYQYTGSAWSEVTNIRIADNEALISDAFGSIEEVQTQLDGVVETNFYANTIGPVDANGNILLDVEPYQTWQADGTKDIKIYDTYVLYEERLEDGVQLLTNSWQFIQVAIDTPLTDSEGYMWKEIIDAEVEAAYQEAIDAGEIADSKIRTFYGTEAERLAEPMIADDVGDIWYQTGNINPDPDAAPWDTDNTIMFRYDGTAWVEVKSMDTSARADIYRNDVVVASLDGTVSAMSTLEHTVDGRISGVYLDSTSDASDFNIVADTFSITHPDNFHYEGTTKVFDPMLSYDSENGVLRNTGSFKAVSITNPNDYSILDNAELVFYKDNQPYKYLKQMDAKQDIENGTLVILDGFFAQKPKVIVSPYNMQSFKYSANNRDQSVFFSAYDLIATGVAGQYSFTAKAVLSLGVSEGEEITTFNNAFSVTDNPDGSYYTSYSEVVRTTYQATSSHVVAGLTAYGYGYDGTASVEFSTNGTTWVTVGSVTLRSYLATISFTSAIQNTSETYHYYRTKLYARAACSFGGCSGWTFDSSPVYYSAGANDNQLAEGTLSFIAIG